MNTFKVSEIRTDLNRDISETLGVIGAVIGACTGATLGFFITAPLAASGALLISAGFLGAGIFGGAFMGSSIVWATGCALGYVINYFF
ncbi:MAG: hypothetical protein HYX61_13165 [Gammaproteobacteria bacterium]|nr:hypothetical protein [Gammaproteobacteria bacterium]